MEYGYIKVASAVPLVSVANCNENVKNIENLIAQAEGQGVEIIVFPELCLTGYTCQDPVTLVRTSSGNTCCSMLPRWR